MSMTEKYIQSANHIISWYLYSVNQLFSHLLFRTIIIIYSYNNNNIAFIMLNAYIRFVANCTLHFSALEDIVRAAYHIQQT